MTRKLKLTLEDLDVQTFHVTDAAGRGDGTVFGNATGQWEFSCGDTCLATCGQCELTGTCRFELSCAGSCDYSCGGTCAGCPRDYTYEFTCDFTCGPCGDYTRGAGGSGNWEYDHNQLGC